MSRMLLSFFVLFGLVSITVADNGLVNVKSTYSVKDTTDKLEKALAAMMTVFIGIDHSASAKKDGLALPPTELVTFGNPKVGTPLMQYSRSVAIDLPQKALIWEDDQGQVWLTYNDPAYLASRHAITGCEAVLEKVGGAL